MKPTIPRGLAQRIRLVVFDVDGVLTDGGLFLGTARDGAVETKQFHVPDGLGIKLLMNAGLRVAFISARRSEATTLRGRELGVDEVIQDDTGQKLEALVHLTSTWNIGLDAVAFVGDDLPDLPVMERVGLPVAVGNAVPEVKEATPYVTARRGGYGAVREFCEQLLKARGEWQRLLDEYVGERTPVEMNDAK